MVQFEVHEGEVSSYLTAVTLSKWSQVTIMNATLVVKEIHTAENICVLALNDHQILWYVNVLKIFINEIKYIIYFLSI